MDEQKKTMTPAETADLPDNQAVAPEAPAVESAPEMSGDAQKNIDRQ